MNNFVFYFLIVFLGGILIGLLMSDDTTIEHSGFELCSSTFHTNCEGICQGTNGLVLHYGYRADKCRLEVFNETNEDEMWEEFCKLIE